jgi:hypothetical protein
MKFMLHGRQVETLIAGIERWSKGRLADWLEERHGEV